MLLPLTPVFTQVLVMLPDVQPVVRPTLFTVVPTGRHPPRVPQSSALMLNARSGLTDKGNPYPSIRPA